MAEFLLEILSEDIPARMQLKAAEDLKNLLVQKLGVVGQGVAHSTPRRLSVVMDLPVETQPVREEKRGPRVGAPDAAIEGFLRGAGLNSLDQCQQMETPKGAFWFAVIDMPGRRMIDVLSEILPEVIRSVPWPKSMRWGNGHTRWVRPMQSIVALFDGQIVPGGFQIADDQVIPFGKSTEGHRFMGPGRFDVVNFADYRDKLREARVVLDRAERKTMIADAITARAAAEGLAWRGDDGLLDEVAGLVEWPVPLVGRIDDQFMSVPAEVLVTSMRSHQRYFALQNKDGSMASRFAVIANMETLDGGQQVVAGNERVLRARLSDARFFWDQDRKIALESRLPALDAVTFHEKLGSVGDKVRRVEKLVEAIALVIKADVAQAVRAARLAKADLVSGMVGEFPELQGIMGRYYAQGAHEPASVAEAIADHYKPAGANDNVATAPVSIALALADRIDTLVGFFAIDEKPTGSKDPFALRRAALGVIRTVLDNNLRVDLNELFARAIAIYGRFPANVGTELLSFFHDRFKVLLKDRGLRHDLVEAVLSVARTEKFNDDLVPLVARIEALQAFMSGADGANLLAACHRAGNIVRIERQKQPDAGMGDIEIARLETAEEKALHQVIENVAKQVDALEQREDYSAMMGLLAQLRGPLDAFFDKVIVNAEDAGLRANRLRLLARLNEIANHVADFSKIEA